MTSAEVLKTPEMTGRKLDAIVVLGHNIGVDWGTNEIRKQRFHLSPHSRINVLAAGLLYKSGIAERIIFSTGNSGKDYPSEASAMKVQLNRIFPSIPNGMVIVEDRSYDTKSNAEEVKKIINKYSFKSIGLLTPGFHLDRAQMLFKRAGLSVVPFVSEEELRKGRQTQLLERFVENYLASDLYREEIKRHKTAFRMQVNPLVSEILSRLIMIKRSLN